jgi:hypothetical protein
MNGFEIDYLAMLIHLRTVKKYAGLREIYRHFQDFV